MLTAERARELLDYDPATGEFVWRVSKGPKRAGTRAGSPTSDGYRRIMIDAEEYQEHRVAWLWMTGDWPADVIDHRDGNKQRNVWANLRGVTVAVNRQNQRHAQMGSKSGLLGVCANGGKWQAQIGHEGANLYLGLFDTKELAHQAYLSQKRSLHPGCTI